MTIRLRPALTLLLAFAAAPVAAQDYWPPLQQGSLGSCEAIRGIGLFRYHSIDRGQRWTRYVMSDTCFSPEAGWYVGPETISGIQSVMDYGGGSARMEVIGDGPQAHQRRSVSVGPIYLSMGMEEGPSDTSGVSHVTTTVPNGRIGLYPDAESFTGKGFSYGAPRSEISGVPDGLYMLEVEIAPWGRNDVREPIERGPVAASLAAAIRAEGGAIRLVAMAPTASDVYVGFDPAAGGFSGRIVFSVTNPRLPAARAPDEFATAQIDVPYILGRWAEHDGNPLGVAVGLGRIVMTGPAGQGIDIAEAQMTIMPAPPGIGDDDARRLFAGASR